MPKVLLQVAVDQPCGIYRLVAPIFETKLLAGAWLARCSDRGCPELAASSSNQDTLAERTQALAFGELCSLRLELTWVFVGHGAQRKVKKLLQALCGGNVVSP